ncbi:MAG: hypothetical protein SGPRY_013995, partial [Prymnesium sp.]
MLEMALEMDVGRYVKSSSPIVLFVLRLLARVDGFAQLVLSEPAAVRGAGGFNRYASARTELEEQWGRVWSVLKARA